MSQQPTSGLQRRGRSQSVDLTSTGKKKRKDRNRARQGKLKRRDNLALQQGIANLQDQTGSAAATVDSKTDDDVKQDNTNNRSRIAERAPFSSAEQETRFNTIGEILVKDNNKIFDALPDADAKILLKYVAYSSSQQATELYDYLRTHQDNLTAEQIVQQMKNIDVGAAIMYILRERSGRLWGELNFQQRRLLERALTPQNKLADQFRKQFFQDSVFADGIGIRFDEFDESAFEGYKANSQGPILMGRLFDTFYHGRRGDKEGNRSYPYDVLDLVETQSLGPVQRVGWDYGRLNDDIASYDGFDFQEPPTGQGGAPVKVQFPAKARNITVNNQAIRVVKIDTQSFVRWFTTHNQALTVSEVETNESQFPEPDRLVAALRKLPSLSLRYIREIVLYPILDPHAPTTSMSTNHLGRVTVYPTGSFLQKDNRLIVTLMHESGHALSEDVNVWGPEDTKQTTSGWDNWRKAMGQDLISPSRYASFDDGSDFVKLTAEERKKDPFSAGLDGHEDFGETYALYALTQDNPELHDSYRTMFPARFQILDTLFGQSRPRAFTG